MIRASLTALALSLVLGGCAVDDGEIASASVPAQPAADWRPIDAETGKIADVAGLAALSEDFPDSSSVKLRLLNAQLQAGEGAMMLDTLRWLNERGYVFSEVAREQIPKLIGEGFADRASALLLSPEQPVERSSVEFVVPAQAGLIESLIVDEQPKRMVATSVSGRSIWGTRPDGSWKPVTPENVDNLSGMVDEDGKILWVSSGNIDQSDDAVSLFSGLVGLRGAREEIRLDAPEGSILSDIHLAKDRTIYVSDPIGGGIYYVGPEREKIDVLLAKGNLRSPQGLSTGEDGQLLYVSDYRYGIAIIDLATREVSRLRTDIPVILDGTDALFRRGNSLIAIQNGTSPMRISQFDLSNDGMRVVGHRILEMAHSEWTEPLGGYLGEKALYYVGNGQWDKYVAGVLGEGKEPDATQIRRLPITD